MRHAYPRNHRALKIASTTSAAIALLAASATVPALAAEEAPNKVSAATATKLAALSSINLPDGVLVQDSIAPTVAADGTPQGYMTVAPAETAGIALALVSDKTELTVGDTDVLGIKADSVGPAISGLEFARVVGAWSVSDDSVLTVNENGGVQAVAPGTATITFTPDTVLDGTVIPGDQSFTLEVTVVAAVEPAPVTSEPPAPEETPTPEVVPAPADPTAPVAEETETPAPVETSAPAPAPVASETPAPVATETPAVEEAPVKVQNAAAAETAPAPQTSAPAAEETVPAAEPLVAGNAVAYQNCADVRDRLGRPIHRGEEGYESKLDRDGDGIGCELPADYENEANQQGSSQYGGSTGTTSAESRSAFDRGDYASTNPANASYSSEHQRLAHTGTDPLGIFASGLALLGAGTATVLLNRRKSA